MNKNQLSVSVVVNTNSVRRAKLIQCLRSIQHNVYRPREIIVVQQTDHPVPFVLSIQTFQVAKKGAGFAKNRGIEKARGDIVVFTDDDCLVSSRWLETAVLSFQKHPEAVAVFGRVLPYQRTKRRGYGCPCVVTRGTPRIFSAPVYHGKVGSGNNMAIRRTVIARLGGFKEWLGPGSVGEAAEDAEIILRLLTHGYRILYEPELIVYHNRWLDKNDLAKQFRVYLRGEVACYAYYAVRGYRFAWRRLVTRVNILLWRFKHLVKLIVCRRDDALSWLSLSALEITDILKGLIVGGYYSIKAYYIHP